MEPIADNVMLMAARNGLCRKASAFRMGQKLRKNCAVMKVVLILLCKVESVLGMGRKENAKDAVLKDVTIKNKKGGSAFATVPGNKSCHRSMSVMVPKTKNSYEGSGNHTQIGRVCISH